jgi:hypothetical protein
MIAVIQGSRAQAYHHPIGGLLRYGARLEVKRLTNLPEFQNVHKNSGVFFRQK